MKIENCFDVLNVLIVPSYFFILIDINYYIIHSNGNVPFFNFGEDGYGQINKDGYVSCLYKRGNFIKYNI